MPIDAVSMSRAAPIYDGGEPVSDFEAVLHQKSEELFKKLEEEGEVLTPIYRAMAAVILTMAIFSQIRGQTLDNLDAYAKEYMRLTEKQIGWMYGQAVIIAGTGLLSGGLGIAAGFYRADQILADPTLETTKQILKFSSKIASSLGDAGRTMLQCPVTEYEARRTIMSQICFQEAHDRQSSSQEMIRKAHQFILGAIEQKGRGG